MISAFFGTAQACGDSAEDSTPKDSGTPSTTDSGAGTTSDAGGDTAGEPADAGGGSEADAGPDATPDAAPDAMNIVEIAAGDSRFSSLVAAVMKAQLVDALSAPGPLTVFAPTDEAFAAALTALGTTLEDLTAEDLTPILTYHVLEGSVKSTDLAAGPVKMLSGISAFVSTEGGARINDAKVVMADIEAENGVIHVIDKVLLPPNLVEAATLAGDFSSLLGAATSAGLADTLSAADADLTVFAPTDEAFSMLASVPTGDALKDVLLYHVVSGKVLSTDLTAGPVETLLTGKSVTVDLSNGVMINDAKVTIADIITTNGVIHVIDKVLIPPS